MFKKCHSLVISLYIMNQLYFKHIKCIQTGNSIELLITCKDMHFRLLVIENCSQSSHGQTTFILQIKMHIRWNLYFNEKWVGVNERI